MSKERVVVYPGSFDPITNGHVSIVVRALTIFDRVIVAVAVHLDKAPTFSVAERVEMIRHTFRSKEYADQVEVDSFTGLTVEYARRRGSNTIIRGIRGISDFEYEFQLALMNRKLNPDIHSIFLMTDYRWFYISSSMIKDVARLGANVSALVPLYVNQKIREKFKLPH